MIKRTEVLILLYLFYLKEKEELLYIFPFIACYILYIYFTPLLKSKTYIPFWSFIFLPPD